jgi:hypothetical protein
MELDLGEFICKQNPYTQRMELANNWQHHDVEIDQDYYHYWYFDGRPRRVRKAVRIKYTYLEDPTDPSSRKSEHLLIGYEGIGGGG